MGWLYLFLAGIAEIGWALSLKLTEGFTRPGPIAVMLVTMTASLAFLSLALKTIPLGTGYAVWTGIGAVGTAIGGMLLFNESREPMRLACIALIIAGIVGLKLFSSGEG